MDHSFPLLCDKIYFEKLPANGRYYILRADKTKSVYAIWHNTFWYGINRTFPNFIILFTYRNNPKSIDTSPPNLNIYQNKTHSSINI